jgi:hypothetical protein
MITALLLAGIWSSPCTLTQWDSSGTPGQTTELKGQSAKETYTFSADGTYSYADIWFIDSNCQTLGLTASSENGTFAAQPAQADGGYVTIPNGLSEVDFHSITGSSLGYDRSLILPNSDTAPTSFQIGRGLKETDPQFTMLGMNPGATVFTKQ